MILRLSVLAVFLTLLWSCRSEDFTKAETNPQRNNTEFFKHRSSLSAKNTTDYIRILEEYNRETDFLSKMQDQKGMPIWDKMYVVETETATGLMIPLSYDDETMSSVLFATLDGKNTVTGVRDYDNATLEDIVYNQKISVENRESLFLSFMHMDNRTFGNEQFIGIPKDLFVGKKSDDEYGVLWVRDFAPSSSVITQEAGKLMIIETCFIALHCTHHGTGLCDAEQGCTECGTTFCTYEVIGTADNPFPSTGGGGATGGGGGGGNAPGPNVPSNPCGIGNTSPAFYRPMPGCGGGGTLPEIDDQCERTSPSVSRVNNILHAPTISTEKKALENHAATSFTEYGMAIVGTGSSIIAQDPYTDNDPSNPGGVTITIPTLGDYLASAHSHPDHGAPPPSVKDLYLTLKNAKDFITFQSSFVFSFNGTKYAFVITDRDKAMAFLAAYPFLNNTNNEGRIFNDKSTVGKDFLEILENYMTGRLPSYSGNSQTDGLESAYAEILNKYDMGISIAKTDTNGQLKPLKSVSFKYTIPASGGKKIIGYKAQPCP